MLNTQSKFSENRRAFFLWFGAAISLVDMTTGMKLANLGLDKAFLAIFTGLLFGCAIFFAAGLIGAKEKMAGMESTSLAFGSKGSLFFAFLNVLQLIGWTAVMLQFGAMTAGLIFSDSIFSLNFWIVFFTLGLFLWIISGVKGFNLFHSIIIVFLFLVCMMILYRVLNGEHLEMTNKITSSLSFSLGFDLALVLPLSWSPLIADYTKDAKRPVLLSFVSAMAYFIASFSMFSLGLLGAYYLQLSEIVPLFALVGGTLSLFVLFFSTITTAYLDVFSAAVSFSHLLPKKYSNISTKYISVLLLFLSCIVAIVFPSSYFESFLYLIASVFLPMLCILIFEYYMIKKNSAKECFNICNILLWGIAFLLYNSDYVRNSILGSSTIIILSLFIVFCIKYFIVKKGNHDD